MYSILRPCINIPLKPPFHHSNDKNPYILERERKRETASTIGNEKNNHNPRKDKSIKTSINPIGPRCY